MKCEECKYWEETDEYEPQECLQGFCHRYPPMQSPLAEHHHSPNDFFVSRGFDWCGEFEAKTTSDAVVILHERYIKGSKKRLKRLEKEREKLNIA